MNETHALDRRRLSAALCELVSDHPGGNILLAGPWGSGKSALLKTLGRESAAQYEVISFSPSEQIAASDPRIAFLRQLKVHADRLKSRKPRMFEQGFYGGFPPEKTNLLSVEKKKEILDSLLGTLEEKIKIMDLFVPAMGSLSSAIVAILRPFLTGTGENKEAEHGVLKEQDSEIELQRKFMRALLNGMQAASGKDKQLLLLVDDLDRTRPEQAVDFLESLYHLFLPHEGEKAWPLTSVWAVNTAVLEEYFYREYREIPSFDPAAYLEKLFLYRLSVPPLFARPACKDQKCEDNDPCVLWRAALADASLSLPGHTRDELAEQLAEQVNYAALGNLRLHARLRRDCVRYWEVNPPADCEQMIRQARLLYLVAAFGDFRNHIALYNGMWPHFINRLNERLRRQSLDIVTNPIYRHIDSADLSTLLGDLGAMVYDPRAGKYVSQEGGVAALQRDLARLMADGI